MKGPALYNQEKFDESQQAYSRALELDPNDFEAWNNKGIDEGLLGRYDEALKSFKNAVALNESYAEAWYNMGVIYPTSRTSLFRCSIFHILGQTAL
jgi:tetratricopeptide (TPR) repeat protein